MACEPKSDTQLRQLRATQNATMPPMMSSASPPHRHPMSSVPKHPRRGLSSKYSASPVPSSKSVTSVRPRPAMAARRRCSAGSSALKRGVSGITRSWNLRASESRRTRGIRGAARISKTRRRDLALGRSSADHANAAFPTRTRGCECVAERPRSRAPAAAIRPRTKNAKRRRADGLHAVLKNAVLNSAALNSACQCAKAGAPTESGAHAVRSPLP